MYEIIMGKMGAAAALRFSSFLLKAFVSLVKRLIDMRMVRFCRSTNGVEALSRYGFAAMYVFSTETTFGGLYLPEPMGSASDFKLGHYRQLTEVVWVRYPQGI